MLTCELCLTAGAHKALLMPRLIPIGHATFRQGLKTQVIINKLGDFFFFRISQGNYVGILF